METKSLIWCILERIGLGKKLFRSSGKLTTVILHSLGLFLVISFHFKGACLKKKIFYHIVVCTLGMTRGEGGLIPTAGKINHSTVRDYNPISL